MIEKQPQALASAYRRAVGKLKKIKELEITPDMSTDEQDELVRLLAEHKAEQEGKDWKRFVSGQRWYVEELIKFSRMETHERLEYEYALSFPDTASEEEMLVALEAMASA